MVQKHFPELLLSPITRDLTSLPVRVIFKRSLLTNNMYPLIGTVL